ncbi:MAG: hypothetical protein HOO96_42315 [Polyangiaceae bacterium]|nr:hypothetical protein [Polyangiaceae bacterium]
MRSLAGDIVSSDMKTKERKHVFSAPRSETDIAALKRISEHEKSSVADLFRRYARSEFDRLFPGEPSASTRGPRGTKVRGSCWWSWTA